MSLLNSWRPPMDLWRALMKALARWQRETVRPRVHQEHLQRTVIASRRRLRFRRASVDSIRKFVLYDNSRHDTSPGLEIRWSCAARDSVKPLRDQIRRKTIHNRIAARKTKYIFGGLLSRQNY